VTKAAEERAAAPLEPPPAPEPPPPPSVGETEQSTEPIHPGQSPFFTASMAETQELQPLDEQDPYTTMMIPVSRSREMAPPSPPEEVAPPPPPDPPTEPIAYEAPAPSPPVSDMRLGALDDEPPHGDLEADIAAFEASGRSATRPDLWDSPAAQAAMADLSPEHAPGDLEALAAEASLTDLKSLIPQASRLSDDDIDRIARRVLELSGERIVRKIAWEVVPELAERLVKERLEELDQTE
jgi:hypothetical protein